MSCERDAGFWSPSCADPHNMHALAEYGRAWAVHQLVPFADKLLGIAGAMFGEGQTGQTLAEQFDTLHFSIL